MLSLEDFTQGTARFFEWNLILSVALLASENPIKLAHNQSQQL